MKCDHCGRAVAGPLELVTAEDGKEFCGRASCLDAFEEEYGHRRTPLIQEVRENVKNDK